MWYEKGYINRRDWILENLGALKLSSQEAIVVMMIDYLTMLNQGISLESLAKRCHLPIQELDEVIHVLTVRKVLSVQLVDSKVVFDLSGLFQNNIYEYVDDNIFSLFEGEFSRPLSQPEVAKLNEWMGQYPEAWIIEALRTASINNKCSMNYIYSILVNKAKQ